VPANKIEAKGYGFDKPVASNKNKDGRAQNRRVEITISGNK
jgi:OOP family OmpA-OmpF porin